MYFDMTSYTAGAAGPMWPQEQSHHQAWNQWAHQAHQENYNHGNWNNLWGQEQPKHWEQSKSWGQENKPWVADNRPWMNDKLWGQEKAWGQDDYSEYNAFQVAQSQGLDNRLRHQASSQLCNLNEEPDDVLVVNSLSSGAYSSLCADAAAADLVGFDAEWKPDHAYGSDNPISVLQLAFPLSRRVYVLQLGRLDNKLPAEVQMMLVNPEVRKVGFAVDLNDRAKMARSRISLTNGSVTDIQEMCGLKLGVMVNAKSLSLKNAAFGLLGFNLAKDKRISCSDWSSQDLSGEQVRYAALDAWVPLRLCYQLI